MIDPRWYAQINWKCLVIRLVDKGISFHIINTYALSMCTYPNQSIFHEQGFHVVVYNRLIISLLVSENCGFSKGRIKFDKSSTPRCQPKKSLFVFLYVINRLTTQ